MAIVLPVWWTLAAIGSAILVGAPIALRQRVDVAFGAALVAAAIEASFYAASGFPSLRKRVQHLPRRALWLALSTLPAYFIYAAGTGTFQWRGLVLLVILAVVSAWWFEVLPAGLWTDLAFLALIAAGLLTDFPAILYPPLSTKLKTDYIGRIVWLRLGYWAILVMRNRGDMGFGFIPRRQDWSVGLRYSGYCVAVAAVLLWWIQPMRLKDNLSWTTTPMIAIATFAGFLWVVAASEELLARGVLQGDLTRAFRNDGAALILASILFGLVHLPYGHEFPNWRMVALATVLGLFCGRGTQRAGSVRAGMVTHALVVTLFRVFLTKR